MRILEKIYQLATNQNLAEFHKSLNLSPKDFEDRDINKQIITEFGSIYYRTEFNRDFYFVIKEKVDDELYECYLITSFPELANHNDLIVFEKDTETWLAIHTWLKIYLTEKEIKNSIFINYLSSEDKRILLDYENNKIKELPKNKRGIIAFSENSYQIKYHKYLSNTFKDLILRVFIIW